jgi:transcriptional regulator with XRE-family HTH domain
MAKKSINNGPKVPEACVRIQKLRRILGLSVSAFALECNYSRGHVSGIEHHVYMPTNGLLRKICVVFNVNPEWLIEGKSGLPVFMPSSSRTENTSELGDECGGG